MKWDKYAKLIGGNSDIAKMLGDHVGSPSQCLTGHDPNFTLPEWVERKLKYVAVRPWANLDMKLVDTQRNQASMRYVIYYHVANEDPRSCYRARYLNGAGKTLSVGQAMNDIVEWYQSYWAKQGDYPLVFDSVLSKACLWRQVSRWRSEVVEETVNIWLAPDGFQP